MPCVMGLAAGSREKGGRGEGVKKEIFLIYSLRAIRDSDMNRSKRKRPRCIGQNKELLLSIGAITRKKKWEERLEGRERGRGVGTKRTANRETSKRSKQSEEVIAAWIKPRAFYP